MPMEKMSFKFPDPESPDSGEEVLVEVEGDTPEPEKAEAPAPAPAPVAEDDDTELEIVDDTPEEDRGRAPAPPPEAVTDEELQNYSEKASKRIKHFARGYHDERRAKEEAIRQREEAIRAAQALREEADRARQDAMKAQEALVTQAKRAAELELAQLKSDYTRAYEAGDPSAIAEAQQKMTSATMKLERLANFKPASLQAPKTEVQIPQPAPAPASDPKAESWRQDNPWFGADEEMTAFALGLHNKLVREGIDTQSDKYYARINARMREVFPAAFAEARSSEKPAEPAPRAKPSAVVAPATRSTAPKKIVLTQTQVQIAKRLGVPLEAYAKQVANEMRKSNV